MCRHSPQLILLLSADWPDLGQDTLTWHLQMEMEVPSWHCSLCSCSRVLIWPPMCRFLKSLICFRLVDNRSLVPRKSGCHLPVKAFAALECEIIQSLLPKSKCLASRQGTLGRNTQSPDASGAFGKEKIRIWPLWPPSPTHVTEPPSMLSQRIPQVPTVTLISTGTTERPSAVPTRAISHQYLHPCCDRQDGQSFPVWDSGGFHCVGFLMPKPVLSQAG